MNHENFKQDEKIDLVAAGEHKDSDDQSEEDTKQAPATAVKKESLVTANDTIGDGADNTLILGDEPITQKPWNQPEQNLDLASTDRADQDLIGKTIAGRIQIISKLGEGGMSVVYKAKHLLLDRLVAVKLIHSGQMQSKALMRFQQEAKAATSLNHNNIATVREFGCDENDVYLVMDFIDGISLADAIKQEGCLSPERTKKIISQVCAGLQHAHESKVVHRDLKPANIVLTKDATGAEVAKIVDFGIARLVDEEKESNLTQTGEVFGTPNYMSPEQCLGKRADARSDIYSLGCVVYECLTGKAPFASDSALETLMRHVNEQFQTPKKSSSKDLMNAVAGCLEKNPDDRWQSAAHLKMFLENPKGPAAKNYKNLQKHFSFRQVFFISCASVIAGAALATVITLTPYAPQLQSVFLPKPWDKLTREAQVQAALGPANFPTALSLFNKALQEAKNGGATERQLEALYTEKGRLLSNAESNKDAIKTLSAALALNEKHTEDFARGSLHDWIAQCYLDEKDYKNALEHANKAIEIKTRTIGEGNRLTLLSLFRAGQAYRGIKDYKQATEIDEKLLTMVNKLYPGKDDLLVADAYHQLANIQADQADTKSAIENYKASLAITSKLLGNDNSKTINERDFLIKYLMNHSQATEASKIAREYK